MTGTSRRDLLIGLSAAACLPPIRAEAARSGRFEEWTRAGPDGGLRLVRTYRPAGWRSGGAVVYMHDGQNVFDAHPGPFGAWGAETAMDRLVAAGRVAPALIVAVDNGPDRFSEYMPEQLHRRLPAGFRARSLGGRRPGSGAYLEFLAETVRDEVIRRHRPSTRPDMTVVMGSSMGGLISLAAAAARPDVFGRAACLSTHWPMLLPGSRYAPHPADADAVGTAFADLLDAGGLRPARHRLYLDHGDRGLDAGYAPYQDAVTRALRAEGWISPRDFIALSFPGADHDEPSWRARLHRPLAYLLGRG